MRVNAYQSRRPEKVRSSKAKQVETRTEAKYLGCKIHFEADINGEFHQITGECLMRLHLENWGKMCRLYTCLKVILGSFWG